MITISMRQIYLQALYDMTKDGQIKHYKIVDNISPIDDYFISVKKREDGEDF